ncbi:hypothetical protein AWI43_26940 [Streptomyces sp. WAC04657]|nr:hypothetical protein AWI43_26940 [Streptomyces sp. WAC04657]
MPVGPSYRVSSRSIVRARSGSEVTPLTGTGRVCGVSPSSAPRITTISTPSSCAKASSSLQKERQRIEGSIPRTRTRSRGLSPPTRTTESLVVGQVIFRTPLSRKTVGRFTWKS